MTQMFLKPLYELMLRSGVVSSTSELYLIVFAAGCAVIAFLVLFLDLCVLILRDQSFLQYQYSLRTTFLAALLMPCAAGIVGMIGLAIDLLQPSRAACIVVGVAWPLLVPVLFGVPQKRDDPDEDNEPGTGEDLMG